MYDVYNVQLVRAIDRRAHELGIVVVGDGVALLLRWRVGVARRVCFAQLLSLGSLLAIISLSIVHKGGRSVCVCVCTSTR